MVFASILKLSPSPTAQLDQPAHGSRAANIHTFGRRFKPASIRRRMASDLVTLATAAHPSIAATSAGKLLVLHFHELDIRVTRFFCR